MTVGNDTECVGRVSCGVQELETGLCCLKSESGQGPPAGRPALWPGDGEKEKSGQMLSRFYTNCCFLPLLSQKKVIRHNSKFKLCC